MISLNIIMALIILTILLMHKTNKDDNTNDECSITKHACTANTSNTTNATDTTSTTETNNTTTTNTANNNVNTILSTFKEY